MDLLIIASFSSHLPGGGGGGCETSPLGAGAGEGATEAEGEGATEAEGEEVEAINVSNFSFKISCSFCVWGDRGQ